MREIKAKVADLDKQLKDSTMREENLKNEDARAKKQLERANLLVEGLADESKSWEVTRLKLKEDEKNLVGNMLAAAASLAYLGPFTADYRKRLIEKWLGVIKKNKIPLSADFSLEKMLSDPIQIREW